MSQQLHALLPPCARRAELRRLRHCCGLEGRARRRHPGTPAQRMPCCRRAPGGQAGGRKLVSRSAHPQGCPQTLNHAARAAGVKPPPARQQRSSTLSYMTLHRAAHWGVRPVRLLSRTAAASGVQSAPGWLSGGKAPMAGRYPQPLPGWASWSFLGCAHPGAAWLGSRQPVWVVLKTDQPLSALRHALKPPGAERCRQICADSNLSEQGAPEPQVHSSVSNATREGVRLAVRRSAKQPAAMRLCMPTTWLRCFKEPAEALPAFNSACQ